MIKLLCLKLVFLFCLTLSAQRIELFGGLNWNDFYDNAENEGHFNSTYTSHPGYAIRLGVDEIKAGWWECRFTMSYDHYSGGLKTSDGGLGGGYITEAEVKKSVLSLGVFPLNVKIIDKFDLSLGMEFSRLLNETFEGMYTIWNMGSPNIVYDLHDKYDDYSASYYFGLQGRIGYEIMLLDHLFVIPQYAYYLGLSKEFDEFPEQTKSMRHYLGIGVALNFPINEKTTTQ